MSEETFNFIAKLLLLFIGVYFVLNYKSLGVRAINDRTKLLSYFGMRLPGSKEMNIRIAQILNLIVGSIFIVVTILDLIAGN